MEEMTLQEWAINFVKNKDLIRKSLKSYEEKDNKIFFRFKDKEQVFLVSEKLSIENLNFLSESISKRIVCLSYKENFEFLINNWKKFSEISDFLIIFVDLSNNNKLIINPQVHNKICDEESFELGLKSMYSNAFQAEI